MAEDSELLAKITLRADELFAVRDGVPRAYDERPDGTIRSPYVTYAFIHKGVEDKREQLVAKMVATLEKLHAHGAVELAWRKRPHFDHEDGSTQVRMRLAAYKADGAPVALSDAREEGDPIPGDALRDDGKAPGSVMQLAEENTLAEKLTEPETDVTERDVVAPDPDAVLLCARICHSVIQALNDGRNEFTVPWDQSRESTCAGVEALIADPALTPAQQHEKWLAYRAAEGWVYGASKDAKAKTHPCMVPYELLPSVQREKDVIFQAIVRSFFGLKS